jgi:hypothetical protein
MAALTSERECVMKSAVLWLVLILTAVFLPSQVQADAAVVQDSCVVVGPDQVRIYFSVINLNLPRSICSFEVITNSDPQPSECVPVGCGAAPDWQCALNTSGGADFGSTAAPGCIAPGTALGGFYVTIDPGFCCYRVRFADESGVVFVQDYVCFTLCDGLPVEESTWGSVKQMYSE